MEKVQERLMRATAVLEGNEIPYAVIGGLAVAHWIGLIDPGAARNTPEVDLLINRIDLERARFAFQKMGFVEAADQPFLIFRDGPEGSLRSGQHIFFADEKVRPEDLLPAPPMTESVKTDQFRVMGLEALTRMKLTCHRRKDQVHFLDLIHVGLIDQTWPARSQPALAERLQTLLDDPNE